MDFGYLNSCNVPDQFVDDLRSIGDLYFNHERDIPSYQESEASSSEGDVSDQDFCEPAASIEWRACDENETRKTICTEMFQVLHGIGKKCHYNLQTHFKEHGVSPRINGNTGRLPAGTCSLDTVKGVTSFLDNYAEDHAVALPGRVPRFKRTDIKLLPSSESKASVHRVYEQSARDSDQNFVSYPKFVELWNTLRPIIRITKPMTDLCFTCQKNNTCIFRCANLPDEEKSQIVKQQEEHLLNAERERSFYKSACNESKDALRPYVNDLDFTETRQPCSFDGKVHYSFDYAQQVHLPSNPMQPGPIFFKTPRKVGKFGMCCEAIPRQVNFLIEATAVGKGANATISYIHDFFEKHGLGETNIHLHADNCCGQNKNSHVLWYLAWRIIVGLHHCCLYSFLMVGHTKFACDWCFGLLKRSFRKKFVSSLYDLATVVDKSIVSGVNVAQLSGLHDGRVIVPTYDWASFLSQYFKKLPGIKKYHHFRFDKDSPGCVYVKQFSDSAEEKIRLLKDDSFPPCELPPDLIPKGMDQKLYLFHEIRPFCKGGTEDLIAPKP